MNLFVTYICRRKVKFVQLETTVNNPNFLEWPREVDIDTLTSGKETRGFSRTDSTWEPSNRRYHYMIGNGVESSKPSSESSTFFLRIQVKFYSILLDVFRLKCDSDHITFGMERIGSPKLI